MNTFFYEIHFFFKSEVLLSEYFSTDSFSKPKCYPVLTLVFIDVLEYCLRLYEKSEGTPCPHAMLTPQNNYYGWWRYYYYGTILIPCLPCLVSRTYRAPICNTRTPHLWSSTLFPLNAETTGVWQGGSEVGWNDHK